MRNSEEKSLSPNLSPSPSPSGNPKIRIAVFGQHEVGKSALTVRYLTKRYIGEYKSNTDLLYQQTVKIGGNSIDVEIVDISTTVSSSQTRRKSFPQEEISRADGFVIVYSITDRDSFLFAQECLQTITSHQNHNQTQNQSQSASPSPTPSPTSPPSPQPKSPSPILLIGNKLDLEHLRVVEKAEGASTAMQHDCLQFLELSVAENSSEVYTSFQNLISTFIIQTAKETSKRKFSVSKMLGNLRIGKTSPSHHHRHVITSQASIVDTDVEMEDESISSTSSSPVVVTVATVASSPRLQRQESVMESDGVSTLAVTPSTSSFCALRSKIVELQSMKRRHNSPPICSL